MYVHRRINFIILVLHRPSVRILLTSLQFYSDLSNIPSYMTYVIMSSHAHYGIGPPSLELYEYLRAIACFQLPIDVWEIEFISDDETVIMDSDRFLDGVPYEQYTRRFRHTAHLDRIATVSSDAITFMDNRRFQWQGFLPIFGPSFVFNAMRVNVHHTWQSIASIWMPPMNEYHMIIAIMQNIFNTNSLLPELIALFLYFRV